MKKTAIFALIALFAVGRPALAQDQADSKARRTGTLVKWTIIGAASGFGVGFLLGFRAYDQATYAERKILRSGFIGAAIGGVAGNMLGRQIVRSSAPERRHDAPVWPTPAVDQPGVRMMRRPVGAVGGPAVPSIFRITPRE